MLNLLFPGGGIMINLYWLGIIFCLSQSAVLSGLNIAVFSVGKLELKVLSEKGDRKAGKLLKIRKNSNHALVTILWGNVGVNVLLALLSDSVMAPVAAFLFATVVITVFAEIMPQAYLTRNAIKLIPLLAPVLKFYSLILYPVSRPTAALLNLWLGGEELRYFRERDLKHLIRIHMESTETEIGSVEGRGALNFLEIDDIPLIEEGEEVDPASIIKIKTENGLPIFPGIKSGGEDKFLNRLAKSGKSWAVAVDGENEPVAVIRTDGFIREAVLSPRKFNPYRHCHRPIVVKEPGARLGGLIKLYRAKPKKQGGDLVEYDVILFWGGKPRIITGSDILGRLLRGIAEPAEHPTTS